MSQCENLRVFPECHQSAILSFQEEQKKTNPKQYNQSHSNFHECFPTLPTAFQKHEQITRFLPT